MYDYTMNANLNLQLDLAHDALSQANTQNRLDLAKYALGLFAGIAASVAPETELNTIFSIASRGSQESTVALTTDAAVALKSIAENSVR